MFRALASFAFATLVLAPASLAHAAGINLSWDDCGEFGVCAKYFACDTNAGASFTLVGSFVPPEGTTAITGEEITLDFGLPRPDGPAPSERLPSWWQFFNAGACRRGALVASIDLSALPDPHCADYWLSSSAQGGLAAYHVGYGEVASRARVQLVFAVPMGAASPLDPALEYYAFRLSILRSATAGTGSCEGCAVPMLLSLTEIKISQPFGVGDHRISVPLHNTTVHWNQDPWSCLPVPARNSTWGAIKGQYR